MFEETFDSRAEEIPKRNGFRILALDGGGVRAIIQSTILSRLVKRFPHLLQEIDLITGVSAGSIVAGAIAAGLTPEETTELWKRAAGKIFTEGFIHRMRNLDHAVGAAYSADDLKLMLQDTLGEKTLADLPIKVLVPSFKLYSTKPSSKGKWHPEFFHNFKGSHNAQEKVVDVVLRSAAAPTYFPAYQGSRHSFLPSGFVDGGVFANNPSLSAVSAAVSAGHSLSEISVLSISTGSNPRSIPANQLGEGNWGLFEWGPHIVELLLDSATEASDWQCRSFLGSRTKIVFSHSVGYLRLDPPLTRDFGLDDAAALEELIAIANAFDLKETEAWILREWKPSEMNPSSLTPAVPPTPLVPPPDAPAPPEGGWKCAIQ